MDLSSRLPMKVYRLTSYYLFVLILLMHACNPASREDQPPDSIPESFEYALVLHGGAGSMTFESIPQPDQVRYMNALDTALQLGLEVLKGGGASIDAVEEVIRYMEDNPLFNAGKGAVFTAEGKKELDEIGSIGMGEAVITTAGEMNANHIIHACGPKFQEQDDE